MNAEREEAAGEESSEGLDEVPDFEPIDEAMAIYAGPNTSLPAATVMLLADLMRWCARVGVHFNAALDSARSNTN